MSLIAGCHSQNLVAARIGLDYRHIAMIGSNSSAQTRITQGNEILLQCLNRSLWCSNGNSMVTPESKPVVFLDWCLMKRENNLELFMNFKLQKSVIVLAGNDFLTVYTSN